VEWFERRYPDDPKRAEAACEVGRAQVLERMTAEGRAALERCLPIYRAWGQAEGDVVASLERVLADSARRTRD
jgi:hypothetical protein